jgi:hyaluronate lyase
MPEQPSALNRRTLLIGGALGLGGIGAGAGGMALFGSGDDPEAPVAVGSAGRLGFDDLRKRAFDLLTGGLFDAADPEFGPAVSGIDAEAAELLESMNLDEDRTALWPDLDPVSSAANFNNSYRQLYRIAVAWATPGTAQYDDEAVAAAVVDGLSLLYDGGYNEHVEQIDNWYWWEIGTPAAMLRTCVILYDRMPPERLADYLAAAAKWCPNADMRVVNPVIHERGANRADKAAIVALRGILGRDESLLRLARDGLSNAVDDGRHSLFQYVTEGDGFYRDGALIQHDNVPYAAAYGTTLLSSTGLAVSFLAGSVGEVTDPNVPVLYDSVESGFAPFMEDGLFMDCLCGRGVSRPGQRDYQNGAGLITAVTQLAVGSPEEYRSRWAALVKGWVERSQEAFPYAEQAGVAGLGRVKRILEDDSVEAAPRPGHTRVYAGMDRVLARRPSWSWALSLSSNRVAAYEMGNWENLHGWYQGDGMTYLYLPDDPDHYNDEFWPTVDPYRLPGTTVDTREREVIAADEGMVKHLPENDVAGGAALGDRYAAAAMELIADGSTLRAKKAWFVLDDAVVALGADVTASDGRTVETTVEHRNLGTKGAQALSVNGDAQPTDVGWAADLDHARWVHLQDVGGYVFPAGAAGLRGLRETRSGAWNDIEQGPTTGGGDTTVHDRRYATLWFDHGVSPNGGSYAYVVLPAADEAATATFSGGDSVRILANTPAVQAVESEPLGLVAAHFWQAGEAGGLACDGPASVLVRRGEDGITVAVADPGRTAETVTIELPYTAGELLEADDTVTAVAGDRPQITVAVGGSRGATHTARLR